MDRITNEQREAIVREAIVREAIAKRDNLLAAGEGAAAPSVEPPRMPSYGDIPWADLEAAITEATGASCQWDDKFHIGHQHPGINMNSLNRIVSLFVRRAAAPVETAPGENRE